MKVVFAAGGTGGHIYPAVSIADELRDLDRKIEILFISGMKEIERKIMENTGYNTEYLPVSGMPRKLTPEIAGFMYRFVKSMGKTWNIIEKYRPTVVVATGGYVSAPVILCSGIKRIPVAIQEQNSFPGLTNRKLSGFADTLFLGFDEAEKHFGKTGAEIVISGNPIRKSIEVKNRAESASFFNLSPDKKTLLVFGGSQGAFAINERIPETLERLTGAGIQVLWQTGTVQYSKWKENNDKFGGNVRVYPFIENMSAAYSVSDMVVARAGAIAIAEITACGLPSLLIPLPTAAANHQEKNARVVENAGAGIVIPEKSLDAKRLAEVVMSVLLEDNKRINMSEAAKRLGNKDAARIIAEKIIEKYGN